MAAIIYYLFLKPLSLLPLRVLYIFSDILAFIFFRLIGFRKKVVLTNLKNSFPERSDAEIQAIAAKFYSHLCDVIVESVRSFSIPKEELLERVKVMNPEIFTPYYEQGQSIILAGGHYNNWEMTATSMAGQIPHHVAAIYKPFGNRFFNDKVKASRGQLGMEMVPKSSNKDLFKAAQEQAITIVLGTDQSPSNAKRAYWMEFLNQDTAVLFGTEKYAKQYGYPVVFGWVKKVKRGYYELTFEMVTDQPQQLPYGAITEMHTRLLEQEIRQAPAYWLWTHKRWKRKRSESQETVTDSASK
jgi:KDO2-lipid IV(A) lauroyltransferase